MTKPFASMRAVAVAGLALVVMAVGRPASGAGPGYVFYYHTFGDWTVVCALDEPTGRRDCRFGAPDPHLMSAIDDARVSVDIIEPIGGDTLVVLRIGPIVDTGRPVTLAVDGLAPHQAALARTGETAWRGDEAKAMIEEMAIGQTLSVRFVRLDSSVEVERQFRLAGFASAHQAYRQRLAAIARSPR